MLKMQNFSEMQSLALSSPKETKAMKKTDKRAFIHIRRGFLFGLLCSFLKLQG